MESFNTTVIVLTNGDQIVCDLREVYDGEGDDKKGLCLMMTHPYILSLVEVESSDNSDPSLQVKFSKWCPYSTNVQFKIPYNAVIAIGDCDPLLAETYLNKVKEVEDIKNMVSAENE